MLAAVSNTVAAGVKACCKSIQPYLPNAHRVSELARDAITFGGLLATAWVGHTLEKSNHPILAVCSVLTGLVAVSIYSMPNVRIYLRAQLTQRLSAAPAA